MKILFVCLGNICRSPAAEGVALSLISEYGLGDQIKVDSAGTSAFHEGEMADSRMREHALARGVELTSRARKFLGEKDLDTFDMVIAMDKSNYKNIKKTDQKQNFSHKVSLMTDFCQKYAHLDEVPDPYYGGEEGFEFVLDLVEDAVRGMLEKIQREK